MGKYLKHPIRPTEWGFRVLRARLSLHETQAEFAKRFMVQTCTVNNWETGKTQHTLQIHKQILERLIDKIQHDGYYMPESVFITIMRERIATFGNALI